MPTVAANTVLYNIFLALSPAVDTYSLVQSTATPPTTTLDGVVSVAESVMRLTLEPLLLADTFHFFLETMLELGGEQRRVGTNEGAVDVEVSILTLDLEV